MKRHSEYQCLSALSAEAMLSPLEIYKACVAVANTGKQLPSEAQLSAEEKDLLECRRQIFRGAFKEAKKLLSNAAGLNDFLEGDRKFLFAQILHRSGDQRGAEKLMKDAARDYLAAKDLHRELRARVNAAICVADLDRCLMGDLYAFELEARSQNFFDIAANICRTRAVELLRAARMPEAYTQAMEAKALYEQDGYPDDKSVALLLAALAKLSLGEMAEAEALRSQALITEGKVSVYANLYESLLQGRQPHLPTGHPLASVAWKNLGLKLSSVPGKIMQCLRDGPRSRDELIDAVWGPNALSPAYCSRLYTAINSLKKTKGIAIIFDGEKYRIAG